MQAKVIYAKWRSMSRDESFNVSMGEVINNPALYEVIGVYEVDEETHEAVCERLFERFNIGDHGGKNVRSMSVGDIVLFPEGQAFLCAGCGWKKLHEAFSDFPFSKV